MASAEDVIKRGNDAFNNHDLDGLGALYSDDAEFTAPGGMRFRGPQEIKEFMGGWLQGFPDCSIETTRRIVSGNIVVEEGIFRGTQTGVFPTPMGDIPPSGKAVSGAYTDVFVVENDKVVSDHLLFDRMELIEQLGLLPAPATA